MISAFLPFLQGSPILLRVDATLVDRGVIRVEETFPASPGKRGFYFPKYIPGEHRPSGPINGMLALHFYADGKEIAWERDPVELFRFVVDVPNGATTVQARFAMVSEPSSGRDSSGSSDNTTPNLARLKWNRVLLYPEGAPTDRIMIRPKVTLPKGWSMASALVPGEVSVTELVDSPAILGRFYRAYDLGSIGGAPVGMDVMAEEDGYQNVPETEIAKVREMVRQQGLLFGGRHFRKYRFLVTLSDAGAGAGLEHHESSEDGTGLRAARNGSWGELLAHEMTHSWNGKYRRPAGLATPDFHKPMDASGLWVYEGLTQYLGYVQAVRSGLIASDEFRDTWAALAQRYNEQPGRSWRPVVDTARSVGLVRGVGGPWSGERRGTDYYTEGALVWLQADCIIRAGTEGKKSLDDFVRRFYGGTTDTPVVKPYETADVVAALGEVLPYDWKGFLYDRIDRVHLDTPTETLARAGFRLAYAENAPRGRRGSTNLPMLGMTLSASGAVTALTLDGPALAAGIGPGMGLTKLDGKDFRLSDLVEKVSKPGSGTVTFETSRGTTVTFPYVGGPFSPRLEPIPGKPNLLDAIAKPLP